MKRPWSDVSCAAGLAMLTGCGAMLTFKPGASPGNMATDERACREGGDAGFVECMRDRGWYVKDTSTEPTPVAVAAEAITPRATATPAVVSAAPAAASASPPSRSPAPPPLQPRRRPRPLRWQQWPRLWR